MYRVFRLKGQVMLLYFGSPKENNTTYLSKQWIQMQFSKKKYKMYDWSNKVRTPVSLPAKSLGRCKCVQSCGIF